MNAFMTQHPVGQGGLTSGSLNIGDDSFHWVYDCGSNQRQALGREVCSAAVGGVIDFLFLSHLDSDHVNGIDLLLAQSKVKEVILPYMHPAEIIAVMAQDSASGEITGTFLDLVSNLGNWFASRGVERVTIVNRGDSSDADGVEFPTPSDGPDTTGGVLKWFKSAEEYVTDSNHWLSSVDDRLYHVRNGNGILARSKSGYLLNWILIPYAHAANSFKLRKFQQKLAKNFPNGHDPRVLAGELKSQNQPTIQKLRECYDCIWSNHNLVSMSLYSGPLASVFQSSLNGPGWILTGDSNLLGLRRRRAFTSHYQQIARYVGAFMAPHHGSCHNLHPDVVSAFPKLMLGFAAAGANSYGHPDRKIRNLFNRQTPLGFKVISEDPSSQLSCRVLINV